MSNTKRVLDRARKIHIEICADADVSVEPFVGSAKHRDAGAEVISNALEEGLVPSDVVAELANVIGKAIVSVAVNPSVARRLLISIDGHLKENIKADSERLKAASASPRLASLIIQQMIWAGADMAVRALIDNDNLRRMPHEGALLEARKRRSDTATSEQTELAGQAVRELINRHFQYQLRDPRNQIGGQRLGLGISAPFPERDGEPQHPQNGFVGAAVQAPAPFVQDDGKRASTLEENMLNLLIGKKQ